MRNPFRDLFRTSFLERNQKVIGAIGILALLVGSGFALLLSGGVFARTYKVTAFFADAASITPGDKVTVAGLDAGTVKGLEIENGHVAITLGVSDKVRLPADSRATVDIQTLLGRKSVAILPGQSSRTLQNDAVIPISRTSTPVNINELNDISVNLLRKSDAQALNDMLAEITKVTEGKHQQVQRLVAGLDQVTTAVDARRSELGHLITALESLSTTLGDKDQTIISLIDNLNPVLANLSQHQQDLKTLLVATDAASNQTADLVQRDRSHLDTALNSLHTDLMTVDQHQVDLAEALSYLNVSVQGYSSVGYSQGQPNQWANIFVQSLGPAGVDELIGKCGMVDQLFDKVFGTDCTREPGTSVNPPTGGGGPIPIPTPSLPVPVPTVSGPLPIPTPSLPLNGVAVDDPALPQGLQSYVDWLLGQSGGV
jgi:phospholipid/cholesterol/gamma-HCH transport system substrate-binding protein